MCDKRQGRAAGLLSVLAGILTPIAVAQTADNQSGRALDAPTGGQGGFLGPAVGPSQSSIVGFNLFSTSINLPTLSAEIGSDYLLSVPSLNPIRGVNNAASFPRSVPLGISQPYGLTRRTPANILASPSFDVDPLPNTLPTTGLPSVGLTRTHPSAGYQDSFHLDAGSSLPLPRSAELPSLLDTTAAQFLSNLGLPEVSALSPTAPDDDSLEEILGASPLFGPTPSRSTSLDFSRSAGTAPRPPLPGGDGLTPPNFGASTQYGVSGLVGTAETMDDVREEIARQVRASLKQNPAVPDIEPDFAIDGVPRLNMELPTPSQAVGQPSLIEATLEQARQLVLPEHVVGGGSVGGNASASVAPAGSSSPAVALPEYVQRGQRVFDRMRDSVRWIQRLRDQQGALHSGRAPLLSDERDRVMSYMRGTSDDPLSSFVGQGVDPAELFSRRAEALLKKGEFYRALAQYEVALVADRSNPLLLLGQGHALIGAGEYFGAVRRIEKAIALFPEIAYFKIDLNEFITDSDLIDVRRADLERKLAKRNDYRFRFLLGYIEYYSGLEEIGLVNLDLAAKDAPKGSVIANFPSTLRVGQTLRSQADAPPEQPASPEP